MLMVMHKGNDGEPAQTVYNAVVTKGASLIDFMMFTNPGDINRNPFIMLSTNHNSYIVPGEPLLQVDENGEIQLGTFPTDFYNRKTNYKIPSGFLMVFGCFYL